MPILTVDSKVIFLDFDGVLNTSNYMWQSKKGSRSINPVAIKVLNRLIEYTGAQVVVSSVWRFGKTPEQLTELLRDAGFEYEVLDKTPNGGRCRGEEIETWINSNKSSDLNFEAYLILDDDSDMLYHQRNNFICVPNDCGLTPNIGYKAYRLLMSRCNWVDDREYSDDPFHQREYHKQWTLNE